MKYSTFRQTSIRLVHAIYRGATTTNMSINIHSILSRANNHHSLFYICINLFGTCYIMGDVVVMVLW